MGLYQGINTTTDHVNDEKNSKIWKHKKVIVELKHTG
jgi:hypothetical protein